MATFDNIMTKAKHIAGMAGRKTEQAVEISKLKLQSVQINSMMQSTYERIGTLIYEQEKTGTDNTELVAVCIREIDGLLTGLNDINLRVSQLKQGVKCSSCGVLNSTDSTYCAGCGAKLSRKKAAKTPDTTENPAL